MIGPGFGAIMCGNDATFSFQGCNVPGMTKGTSAALGQCISATHLDLHVLWSEIRQDRLIDLLELRFLFFSSLITVVGLMCNTRAVSRIPLAFMAMSTICRFTSGDCPLWL